MSDSEREQAVVLPVPDSDASSSSDSISAPPVTAEQYLRRVRTEASKLPNTFVASSIQKKRVATNTTSLSTRRRVVPYPPCLSPISQSRATRLVRFFCSLHKCVLQAKRRHRFESTVKIPAASDVNDNQLQQVPDHYDSGHDAHQQVASQLVQCFFSHRRDQWLFALFTLIQPPLSRDVASVLRSILQKAAYARYGVSASEHHRLAGLNVLTTIVAQHFGQHDAS